MTKLHEVFEEREILMTDWSKMVSDEALKNAAQERKKTVERVTNVKAQLVSAMEDDGFTTVKKNKNNRFTMEKAKKFEDVFENEVWSVFYKMGFSIMNSDNTFKVDFEGGNSKQIDVLAIDGETCIIVECKASKTFQKTADFKKELESMHGYYHELTKELKKQYGQLKFKHIFATKNYLIEDDSADAERMRKYNIAYFDTDTVDYYNQLTDHLGTAARYQFLGNIFQGQEIKGIDNTVPAIKGSMGGLDYYTFLIEPEKLLKLSYVLHRNKANHLLMPTYQRLIKKDRLKKIREFINNGGYFPNSLVVSIDDKKVRFDAATKTSGTDSKIGTLYLPSKYRSIYIIDGQHRLYGYSDSKYAHNNVIPVVAFVDLDPDRQVEMFMEINENQKSVSKALRNTLNSDLLWASNDPKKRNEALMLKVAESLGSRKDSPLYERVVTGEDSKTTRRCITTEYLRKAIKASSFLNEYDKNGIKTYGTLDKNDNDKTMPMLMKFLLSCYSVVENGCKEEWEKGGDGFLSINNTAQALIRIFNDILEIVLKDEGKTVVDNLDDVLQKCQPMLNTLVEVINNMSSEDQERIKKFKGGAAEKESWRALQIPMNTRDPNFINAELQSYIETYMQDNVTEATTMIDEVRTCIVDKFRNILEIKSDWKETMIPESLGVELATSIAQENFKRKKQGLHPISEWDLISFIDIKKIAMYQSNWSDFAQAILSRKSIEKNTHATTTKWLINLSNYEKKLKNNKSLAKQEIDDLESIYQDFLGGSDANH